MDANINDAISVTALLDQLRTSQAWQQFVNSTAAPEGTPSVDDASHPVSHATPALRQTPSSAVDLAVLNDSASSSSSVASLLSQLQAPSASSSAVSPDRGTPSAPSGSEGDNARGYGAQVTMDVPLISKPSIAILQPDSTPDFRSYTFQQALPVLASLADDPDLVAAVKTMKAEQHTLERRLFEERSRLLQEHERKLEIALTKAKMIGASGLTKHEADSMSAGFRRELRSFDVERVLPAFDSLMAKQQAALEKLNIPAIFVSTDPADRERQGRVLQVLESVIGSDQH